MKCIKPDKASPFRQVILNVISVLTLPPIAGLIAITWIYLANKLSFGSQVWYFALLIFLFLAPISPYIYLRRIPRGVDNRHPKERKLAFIAGLTSYTAGIATALLFQAPRTVKVIFLAYFLSGVLLAFTNQFLEFKASGHACGVAGPLALLLYFIGRKAKPLILTIPVVFWSRIALGRHKLPELVAGTAIGLGCTVITVLIL